MPLCILVLMGCSVDTNKPETENALVVFGYLYVSEAVSDSNAIFLARTRPVDEYYRFQDALVAGALVTLRADTSSHRDTLDMVEPGYYSNPNVIIQPLQTYHLEIEVGGERVTATTTTPQSFNVQSAPLEVPDEIRHSEIPDSFPVTLQCPDEKQILLLDVYCTEDWRDAKYINPFGSHDEVEDLEEYGGENGEPRHIYGYLRLEDLEHEEDLYTLDWYSAMMVFYGEYYVHFLTIDENYYNYLYRENPERSGGVSGGIGVFGSAYREMYRVNVVE